MTQQVAVERMSRKGGAVADDEQFATSTRHGDIHAPHVRQEADLAFAVRADQRQDHGFLFAALETVDAVDLEAGDREPFTEEPDLCRIGGDDG